MQISVCIFLLINIRQTGLSFSQGYSKLATTKYHSFITPVLKHNLISSKLAIKTGLVNTETHQRPFSSKCTMGHTLTLLQSHSSTVLSRIGFHSLQYVLEMSSTIKSDYGICALITPLNLLALQNFAVEEEVCIQLYSFREGKTLWSFHCLLHSEK